MEIDKKAHELYAEFWASAKHWREKRSIFKKAKDKEQADLCGSIAATYLQCANDLALKYGLRFNT